MNIRKKIVQKNIKKIANKDIAILVNKYDYHINGGLHLSLSFEDFYVNSVVNISPSQLIINNGGSETIESKMLNLKTGLTEPYFLCKPNISIVASLSERIIIRDYPSRDIKIYFKDNSELPITLINSKNIVSEIFILLPNDKIIFPCEDATLQIWNTSNGILEKVLDDHKYSVIDLQLYKKDKLISISYYDKLIIWNILTWEKQITLDGSNHLGNFLCLSNDQILRYNFNGNISLWDPRTNSTEIVFKSDNIQIIKELPNGQLIYSTDNTLIIYDFESQSHKQLQKNYSNHPQINFIEVLLDGRIVTDSEGRLDIWS